MRRLHFTPFWIALLAGLCSGVLAAPGIDSVARRAGVSLSGMKSRVQRARLQLRAIVEECCRIDLDRRGAIASYTSRHPARCACGCGRS